MKTAVIKILRARYGLGDGCKPRKWQQADAKEQSFVCRYSIYIKSSSREDLKAQEGQQTDTEEKAVCLSTTKMNLDQGVTESRKTLNS